MAYALLSGELQWQLERIAPSSDGVCEYRPCRVWLASGEARDFVYVVDAASYIRAWGIWPEDDDAKEAVPVEDVVAVEESPHRLPASLANGVATSDTLDVLREGREEFKDRGPRPDEGTAPFAWCLYRSLE